MPFDDLLRLPVAKDFNRYGLFTAQHADSETTVPSNFVVVRLEQIDQPRNDRFVLQHLEERTSISLNFVE